MYLTYKIFKNERGIQKQKLYDAKGRMSQLYMFNRKYLFDWNFIKKNIVKIYKNIELLIEKVRYTIAIKDLLESDLQKICYELLAVVKTKFKSAEIEFYGTNPNTDYCSIIISIDTNENLCIGFIFDFENIDGKKAINITVGDSNIYNKFYITTKVKLNIPIDDDLKIIEFIDIYELFTEYITERTNSDHYVTKFTLE